MAKIEFVLTLNVYQLFGNAELSFVQTVVVGDVALCLRHGDDHTLLLLPEHRLSRDRPLEMVLLGGGTGKKGMREKEEGW